MKSRIDQYGTVALAIHWISALLVLMLLTSGFIADGESDAQAKANLLRVHVPAGLTLLLLTIARIIWWWRFDTKPDLAPVMSRSQRLLAKSVHLLLYAGIFLLAGSGIAMIAISGAAPAIFAADGASLPDFSLLPPRGPHGAGATILLVLLAAHVTAALYHHSIRSDLRLGRMWFSRSNASTRR